jgi:hypothetical protein
MKTDTHSTHCYFFTIRKKAEFCLSPCGAECVKLVESGSISNTASTSEGPFERGPEYEAPTFGASYYVMYFRWSLILLGPLEGTLII